MVTVGGCSRPPTARRSSTALSSSCTASRARSKPRARARRRRRLLRCSAVFSSPPVGLAALFVVRSAALAGSRPPRLPGAPRRLVAGIRPRSALLHSELAGGEGSGESRSAWAPALGSHGELRGRLRHRRAAGTEPAEACCRCHPCTPVPLARAAFSCGRRSRCAGAESESLSN